MKNLHPQLNKRLLTAPTHEDLNTHSLQSVKYQIDPWLKKQWE
jgi:hypothetical protein